MGGPKEFKESPESKTPFPFFCFDFGFVFGTLDLDLDSGSPRLYHLLFSFAKYLSNSQKQNYQKFNLSFSKNSNISYVICMT